MKKKIFLLVILCFFLKEKLLSQQVDTLKVFAKENPVDFWIFINRFYPFSEEELIKYKDDLFGIDQNLYINWNSERIHEMEVTINLLRNKSIKWSEELIETMMRKKGFSFNELYFDRPLTVSNVFLNNYPEFKDIPHRNYIIETTLDSSTFYYNWDYFNIDKNRLIDFGRMTDWGLPGQDTTNTLLKFSELPEYAKFIGKDINLVPIYVLDSLKGNYQKFRITSNGQWNLSWEKFFTLDSLYSLNGFTENESVYNSLFKPKMSKQYLSELYDTLNKNVSYFNIRSYTDDEIGYVPDIIFPDSLLQYGIRPSNHVFE